VAQARVRQRVLRWFVRQGYLDKDDAKEMAKWNNGGGFSVDVSVRIEAADRTRLERLLWVAMYSYTSYFPRLRIGAFFDFTRALF
jgi:hypothetical protein